jgi:hypothetical protein
MQYMYKTMHIKKSTYCTKAKIVFSLSSETIFAPFSLSSPPNRTRAVQARPCCIWIRTDIAMPTSESPSNGSLPPRAHPLAAYLREPLQLRPTSESPSNGCLTPRAPPIAAYLREPIQWRPTSESPSNGGLPPRAPPMAAYLQRAPPMAAYLREPLQWRGRVVPAAGLLAQLFRLL